MASVFDDPLQPVAPAKVAKLYAHLFAARLRSVCVLNHRKGRKPVARGKGRANLKAKPIVIVTRASKRAPALFATKIQPAKSRRQTNRVIFPKRTVQVIADVIKFPIKMPVLAVPRLRRAA